VFPRGYSALGQLVAPDLGPLWQALAGAGRFAVFLPAASGAASPLTCRAVDRPRHPGRRRLFHSVLSRAIARDLFSGAALGRAWR